MTHRGPEPWFNNRALGMAHVPPVVSRRDSVETTTLFSVVGCVAFSMVVPCVWCAPDHITWIWLLVLGAVSAIGHYLLSTAFPNTPT